MTLNLTSLAGMVPPVAPYGDTQPFTARDASSMLQLVEQIKNWLNDQLVPYVNNGFEYVTDEWNKQTALVMEALAVAVSQIDDSVAQAEAAAAASQASAELAENYSNTVVGYQDTAMTAILNNAASAFRIAAEGLFAGQSIEDIVTSGRLSVAVLDARFDGKTSDAELTAAVDALTDIINDGLALKADKTVVDPIVEATTNGYLSPEELDARFASSVGDALAVKRGGKYPVGLFTRLRDGMVDTGLTTRVAILGDSHGGGGYSTYAEQLWPARLAYRSGASDYRRLEDATNPIPAGMKWWNGNIGGATSGNYYPSTLPAKMALLNPHYVLHFVGSNDWAGAFPVSGYKTNVQNVVSAIESANSNVVSVLIHGARRRDVSSSGKPAWADYGQALKEIVDANPSRRVYIDLDEWFGMFGFDTNNFAGLLDQDGIHFNIVSNKIVADIIGAIMGIPSETDFDHGQRVIRAGLLTGTNLTSSTVLTTQNIKAASYPRIARVSGGIYGESSHNTNEVYWRIKRASDNTVIRERGARFNPTGGVVVPLGGDFYIPPATEVNFEVQVGVYAGNVNYVRGTNDVYSTCDVAILPI